jgi:hypothetical protein
MPVLSRRFNFPVARLYTLCHLFVTLCIYQLHHPQPRSVSLTITLAHFVYPNDRHSFFQSPSSNCVHYKVYFILHFIIYFFSYFFFIPMILVKSPTSLRIFFWSFSLSEHIITLFVRASHQHLFICIHFLSFRRTHLLLVPVSHSTFNPIRLSPDIESAR